MITFLFMSSQFYHRFRLYLVSSSHDKQCGIFFNSLERMSVLSADLGIPISISFSNLPGRRRAGSSESGRLLAAKTKTPEFDDYRGKNISKKIFRNLRHF